MIAKTAPTVLVMFAYPGVLKDKYVTEIPAVSAVLITHVIVIKNALKEFAVVRQAKRKELMVAVWNVLTEKILEIALYVRVEL
jgi:hypothetical protein